MTSIITSDDDGHIAACECDPIGTEADNSSNVMCDAVSGQCRCKPGVNGRQCDQCQPTHVNMSDTGCTGKFIPDTISLDSTLRGTIIICYQ